MIRELDSTATCRFLVERYHRAFEEELPRLERLAWKLAGQADVSLMHALLQLKDELFRHTAVAETTVHPFAGTPDGDVLLDEHVRDHQTIRRVLADTKRLAASAQGANRIGSALCYGLETVERNLETFFAIERTLTSKGALLTTSPLPLDGATTARSSEMPSA